jgi:hypothetical protein
MLLFAVTAMAGCSTGESLGPPNGGPPYIAIVAKAETAPPADPATRYRYRIKDLSAGETLDTVIVAAPLDTVILSVRPATYSVTLDDLPAVCVSRYGVEEEIAVPEGTNTALVRFYLSCNVPLAVNLLTQGVSPDSTLVWQLTGANGSEKHGLVKQSESLIFDTLAPGAYTFSLYSVPERCVITSSGGRSRDFVISPTGGVRLTFFIECSGTVDVPVIQSFRSSYHDGAAVFIARLADPDRNISAYSYDITDCNGHSALPGGAWKRDGVNAGRTAGRDTMTVIGAFELVLPEPGADGRCAALRVEDGLGNTTPVLEVPLLEAAGSRPGATEFNAKFLSTQRIGIQISAVDPDGDLAGTFVAARLRDGALGGPQDGQQDIGIASPVGNLGLTIPDLAFSRFDYTDFYAIIVYVVDQEGHFVRVVDEDLFK